MLLKSRNKCRTFVKQYDVDAKYFQNLTLEMLQRHFSGPAEPKSGGWDHKTLFEPNNLQGPLIYGHYMVPGAADPKYQAVPSLSKVEKLFDEYLNEYNDPTNRNPVMSLVFFQSAIDHISRISRILRQPRGNAMLVGQGGSGKQSTARLGCLIAGAQFSQIELTAQFGIPEFRDALKRSSCQDNLFLKCQ